MAILSLDSKKGRYYLQRYYASTTTFEEAYKKPSKSKIDAYNRILNRYCTVEHICDLVIFTEKPVIIAYNVFCFTTAYCRTYYNKSGEFKKRVLFVDTATNTYEIDITITEPLDIYR